MASWKSETVQPRASGVETSDMYTGTVPEESPIPKPTTILPKIRMPGDEAAAQTNAPTAKIRAVAISKGRRPKRSAKRPPASAPTAAPANTPLTITSKAKVESEKSFLKKSSAPEITPVSYPNRRPPSPAKAAAAKTNLLLPDGEGDGLFCVIPSIILSRFYPASVKAGNKHIATSIETC